MSQHLSKFRTILDAKSKDELNVLARQLNIGGYRKASKDSLVEIILQTEPKERLTTLLTPSWWARYHNHVYGVTGIVLTAIGILLAWDWQKSGRGISPIQSPTIEVGNGNNGKNTVAPNGYPTVEIEEARIASDSESFSPMALDEFLSRWHDKKTTDLQRDQLEKEITGKTIIWTGKITSIRPGDDGGVRVSVTATGPDESLSLEFASLAFDVSQRNIFLNLAEGQLIRFTGVTRRVYGGDPFLENCKLLRVVKQNEMPSQPTP